MSLQQSFATVASFRPEVTSGLSKTIASGDSYLIYTRLLMVVFIAALIFALVLLILLSTKTVGGGADDGKEVLGDTHQRVALMAGSRCCGGGHYVNRLFPD